MLSQEKFYKLSKYSSRLEKSFIKNNQTDYTKYLSHIKYHIGGNSNNDKLNELFDSLIKIIKEKQGDDTYENLKEQNKNYEQDNEVLENKLEKSDNKIKELEKEKEELSSKIISMEKEKEINNEKIVMLENEKVLLEEEKNKLEGKIAKYEQIINNINNKLAIEENKKLNKEIDNDEQYINELNIALEQIKEKETNATESCAANDKVIMEKNTEIEELKAENAKLMDEINKLKKENTELTMILSEKDNQMNEMTTNIEKKVDSAIRKTKDEDIVLFRNKLGELLTAVFGKTMAEQIIAQTEIAEEQASTKKENDAMGNEDIVSKINREKDELLNMDFMIEGGNSTLEKIMNVKTITKKNENIYNTLINNIDGVLNSKEDLNNKRNQIQELINHINNDNLKYQTDDKIRINGNNVLFGGKK